MNYIGFLSFVKLQANKLWSGREGRAQPCAAPGVKLIKRWSGNGTDWDDRHKLALVSGMLAFFIAFDVLKDVNEGFPSRTFPPDAIPLVGSRWPLALKR